MQREEHLHRLHRPPAFEDSADLERIGSTLFEYGPGHVERWEREGEASPTAVVERRVSGGGVTTARIVMVADLFLAVWGGAASGGALIRYDDGGWEIGARVGAGAVPWPAILGAKSGHLGTGWQKVV